MKKAWVLRDVHLTTETEGPNAAPSQDFPLCGNNKYVYSSTAWVDAF